MADFTFACPFCNLELSVDETNAGQEVECPGCNEILIIPTPAQAAGTEPSGLPSEAIANAEIIKPKARPLDIAAKISKSLKIKTFRHHEFLSGGKDNFDTEVSKFISSLIEDDIVSINPIQYSHVEKVKVDDKESERVVAQYGIVVVYKAP
jgi:phage FluMu protein Com